MLQKFIDWTEKYAEHKHAKKTLALVSFVESSFFPIPPFVFILGMLIKKEIHSWKELAFIGTTFSVLGGMFGYLIGKFFYTLVGAPLVAFYGIQSELTHLGQIFNDHVFLTILLASLSPLPYKVFTISAGLFSVNFWQFVLASILGRGIRFIFFSYISYAYGEKAKNIILKNQKITSWLTIILIVSLIIYLFLLKEGII